MRLMACGTTLGERGLMQVRLLHLLRLLAVARQACINRIRLYEPRCLSSMRIVANRAITLRARMLYLRLLDLFCLLGMAAYANSPHIGLRQDNLAVLWRRMAGLATLGLERRVREGLHQLRLC